MDFTRALPGTSQIARGFVQQARGLENAYELRKSGLIAPGWPGTWRGRPASSPRSNLRPVSTTSAATTACGAGRSVSRPRPPSPPSSLPWPPRSRPAWPDGSDGRLLSLHREEPNYLNVDSPRPAALLPAPHGPAGAARARPCPSNRPRHRRAQRRGRHRPEPPADPGAEHLRRRLGPLDRARIS